MKRLAYIFLAASVMAALFSCTKEESTYEPGPKVDGSEYYFNSGTATAVEIGQNTEKVTIDVYRVQTASAATYTINVADTSKLICPTGTATANFAAGQNKATVSFPIDPTKFIFAKDYAVKYSVTSEDTPYGMGEVTVKYKYPTPIKSLGKGTFADSWLGVSTTPEIRQSLLDPNEFHIVKFYGSNSDDLILHIAKAGDTFGYYTYKEDGLVWYDDTAMGITYKDIYSGGTSDPVYLCHVATFKSRVSDELCSNCKVVAWQSNGLPGIITLGGSWYMYGLGGYTNFGPVIQIIFPGYDPKDYTITAAYAGIFKDVDENPYGEATVAFGKDVESGVATVVAGDSEEAIAAAAEALVAGTAEPLVTFEKGQAARVALPEGAESGKYTIVIGAVAGGEVQATESVTFNYQAGGATVIDWAWLEGEWTGLDWSYYKSEVQGDSYTMTITKVDDTNCKIYNLWGSEATFDAVVDFEAKTLTITGYQYAFDDAGGACYLIAVDPTNEYDHFDDLTTPIVATMSPSGIVIDNYDFIIVGGTYDGYTHQGGLRTNMTK